MKRTMKYYKSAKGKASYKKKLAEDVKRSTSKAGLKKRAELKRIRNKAKAGNWPRTANLPWEEKCPSSPLAGSKRGATLAAPPGYIRLWKLPFNCAALPMRTRLKMQKSR